MLAKQIMAFLLKAFVYPFNLVSGERLPQYSNLLLILRLQILIIQKQVTGLSAIGLKGQMQVAIVFVLNQLLIS